MTAAKSPDATQRFTTGGYPGYLQAVWPTLSSQPALATRLMAALALEHGASGDTAISKCRAEADQFAALTPWRQAVARAGGGAWAVACPRKTDPPAMGVLAT